MPNSILTIEDIKYIADMLRAVRVYKNELSPLSANTLFELDKNVKLAEASLRRAAEEMALFN